MSEKENLLLSCSIDDLGHLVIKSPINDVDQLIEVIDSIKDALLTETSKGNSTPKYEA